MSEVDRARRARERGDGRTWRERAVDAEERVTELEAALREIAERCESEDYAEEEQAIFASQRARAILSTGRNTSMTDRLAQIEEWARGPLANATVLRARDVLALVEIAKAARRVLDEAPYLDGPEKEQLRAALAVLDDREET